MYGLLHMPLFHHLLSQVCYVVISVDEEDHGNVKVSVGAIKMNTERELAKYFLVKEGVTHINHTYCNATNLIIQFTC